MTESQEPKRFLALCFIMGIKLRFKSRRQEADDWSTKEVQAISYTH